MEEKYEIRYVIENDDGKVIREIIPQSNVTPFVVTFLKTLNSLDELFERRHIKAYAISWCVYGDNEVYVLVENKRNRTEH